jgi:HAE1 family hydrophobic/amphiphilic exporter-1
MDRKYGAMLEWSLAHRGLMLGIAGAVALSAVVLFPFVGKELVPDDDQSEFSVNMRLARGTSFTRTMEYMEPVEGEVRKALGPDLESLMASIQTGSSSYSIALKPIEERTRSQLELMGVVRRALSKYKGVRTSVSGGTDISGALTGGGRDGGGGSTNRLNDHPGLTSTSCSVCHGAAREDP